MRKLLQLDQRGLQSRTHLADGLELRERRVHERAIETSARPGSVERVRASGKSTEHRLTSARRWSVTRWGGAASARWRRRPPRGPSTKRCGICLAGSGAEVPKRQAGPLACSRRLTGLLRPPCGGRASRRRRSRWSDALTFDGKGVVLRDREDLPSCERQGGRAAPAATSEQGLSRVQAPQAGGEDSTQRSAWRYGGRRLRGRAVRAVKVVQA